MFGNTKQQAVDPDYSLPTKRRVIWEHGQDLATFLAASVVMNIFLAITAIVMAAVLIMIFNKPPVVLAEDQGYVYYRSTEVFKLRTNIIRTFLDVTTGKLLNINPGGYDISGLESFVSPKIIEAFAKTGREEAESRARTNKRQLWYIRDLRRYNDPKLKSYICVAIRGEKVNYEEVMSSNGQKDLKTTSYVSLILAYLEQVRPTPNNPWGLVLAGFYEEQDPEKAKALWLQTVDLTGSPDANNKVIEPARDSLIPKG
jgi:hypothetical protein